jgi:hypothetical protein
MQAANLVVSCLQDSASSHESKENISSHRKEFKIPTVLTWGQNDSHHLGGNNGE